MSYNSNIFTNPRLTGDFVMPIRRTKERHRTRGYSVLKKACWLVRPQHLQKSLKRELTVFDSKVLSLSLL